MNNNQALYTLLLEALIDKYGSDEFKALAGIASVEPIMLIKTWPGSDKLKLEVKAHFITTGNFVECVHMYHRGTGSTQDISATGNIVKAMLKGLPKPPAAPVAPAATSNKVAPAQS